MRLAVVVQRYGLEISGGAELHARYIAELLARHADVRVLTTCARDYVTWRNEFPPGTDDVNGITVERYPVVREREAHDFARRSRLVFQHTHSPQDELDWFESEGPTSPALLERLTRGDDGFDFLLFFSARYHHAFHGARLTAPRAILVPTAEREPSLGLSLLGPVFRGVRAVMYNSEEERALINRVARNEAVPGVVVGIGSAIPSERTAERARQRFGLDGPYLVYVGRIDANKGFPELFDHFRRFRAESGRQVTLVLIGTPHVDIPRDPFIRHLGFVTDQDKFDVLAGSAALIMPSYFESLSMVALEAWALGRPVVANARCDVLVGQCLRSGAGLYYQNAEEFGAVLDRLLDDPSLADALGRRGQAYYDRHYSWPVIERTYIEMLTRLATEPAAGAMEPLPGWLARRRRTLPAAEAVVNALPRGPVLPQATS
jgi:glycosyltransferase involved in cell wall biosynthesis